MGQRTLSSLVVGLCCAAVTGCTWVFPYSSSSDRGGDGPFDALGHEMSPDRRDAAVVTKTLTFFSTRDTMIDQRGPAFNYGSCSYAYLMNTSSSGEIEEYRVLLFFDLESITSTCRVASASLQLSNQDTASDPVSVSLHQLLEDWEEGTGPCAFGTEGFANWSYRKSGAAWGTPGGTLAANPVETIITSGALSSSWDVTTLVQAWVSRTAQNYGLILVTPYLPASNYLSWYTRQAPTALWPTLEVVLACSAAG
jgi:hypothetical protein